MNIIVFVIVFVASAIGTASIVFYMHERRRMMDRSKEMLSLKISGRATYTTSCYRVAPKDLVASGQYSVGPKGMTASGQYSVAFGVNNKTIKNP